jgi:hypothetical protein
LLYLTPYSTDLNAIADSRKTHVWADFNQHRPNTVLESLWQGGLSPEVDEEKTILASVRWRILILAPRLGSSYLRPAVCHSATLGDVLSPNLQLSEYQNRELK